MTVTELGYFFIFIEKVFGDTTLQSDSTGMVKIKDKSGVTIGQYSVQYGSPNDVWLRMDKIPPEKKKDVEKVLQSGRFETIVNDNG